ncbi:hypothetical protein M0Q28_02815 [Patescibacteria group bacterium]|jgi:hypothetical protein|nr:hypothetical protein [Patescibacteria group bacterium]
MAISDKSKTVLTALIQKQMTILGPNVAIGRARRVKGLTLGDDGVVTAIQGDAATVSQALVNEFIMLTGDVTRTLFESLIKNTT